MGGGNHLFSLESTMNSKIEINEVLPCDVEAENALLNSCLSNPDATDAAKRICYAEDFSRNGAEAIFARLVNFRKARRSYTLGAILKSFEDREDSKLFTDFIYDLGPFWHLSDMGPTRHYARIVREFGLRRKIILECTQISTGLFNYNMNLAESIGMVRKLGAVSQARLRKNNEVSHA